MLDYNLLGLLVVPSAANSNAIVDLEWTNRVSKKNRVGKLSHCAHKCIVVQTRLPMSVGKRERRFSHWYCLNCLGSMLVYFPPIKVWMEYEQARFCLSQALYGALILNLSIPVPGDCSSTCLTSSAFLPHPSRAVQCCALASGLWESSGTGLCSDVPNEAQQHCDGGVGWRGDGGGCFKDFWCSSRSLGFHDPIWLAHIFQMAWWKATN